MSKCYPPFFLFVLFSFSQLFTNYLVAQQRLFSEDQIRFKQIGIEQGLSQSVVLSIIQDNRGFMWFGTQDGLNCYDGYRFKVYKNDILNKNSISAGFINCLHQGRNGIIWIGTSAGGVNSFDPRTGKFKNYRNNADDPKSLSSDQINCIYEDKNNNLWIGTNGGGLNILNLLDSTVSFDVKKHIKYDKTSISGNVITSICEDDDGMLWIGTKDGLSIYNPQTKSFIVYRNDPNEPNSLSSNKVKCVLKTLNGVIWIGTEDKGLSIYNPETKRFTFFLYDGIHENAISGNDVNCLYEDNSGRLWIGTEENGITIYDQRTRRFSKHINEAGNLKSLNNNSIKSIYEDISGNIWIGTWGGGLNIYSPILEKFKILQKKFGDSNSLSSNDIASIFEDSEGLIWIGTFSDGVNSIDPETGKITQYKSDELFSNAISNNSIKAINESPELDLMWFGTKDGLFAYNKKTKKTIVYRYDPYDVLSISSNVIQSIHRDRSGALWIGTDKGLNVLNPELQTFKRYLHSDRYESISSDDVNHVFEDQNGFIWISTAAGLNKLNPQTGQFKFYKHLEGDSTSISDNMVFNAIEDKNQIIWVATAGGLNVFNPITEKFQFFTEHDGLPNNVIYGILQDNHGYLWFSTNNGICKFIPPQKLKITLDSQSKSVSKINNPDFLPTIRSYNSKDGLSSSELNVGAFFKRKTGDLLFGGLEGLISLNPDSLVDNKYISPVYITSFKIKEREYEDSITISFQDKIVLDYTQNIFSFEFVTLNYVTAEKNQYAYKMEGLDNDWIYCGNRNYASYNSILPGEYVFRVKACNNDGVWNEEGTAIKIIIKPPFYKTNWFYLLCLVFVVSAVFVYIKWRERVLKLQKKILEKKVTERTRQLKKEKDRVELAYLQIDSKNKEITDSIRYAKRLQEAILPPEKEIKEHLPESFVLYKPKDIVSGDFYYFMPTVDSNNNKQIMLAAVDCTGHGVPGAFMSIVGNNLLNQTINEHGITKPSQVLDELNKGLSETLRQTITEASVKDGMDIALCAIDTQNYKLQYAGAYNPLWIVRKNIADSEIVLQDNSFPVIKDLIEIRADKFPVGAFVESHHNPFSNHEIQLKKGDVFYIFSDGYADQFGGEKGKKFKYRRLHDLLVSINDKPMEQQKEILDKSLEEWKGDLEQLDDILVIGVRLP